MKKKKKRRLGEIIFFAVVVLIIAVVVLVVNNNQKSDAAIRAGIMSGEYDLSVNEDDVQSYKTYISEKNNSYSNIDAESITVPADSYSSSTLSSLEVLEDGRILTGSEGSLIYNIEVEKEGLYYIEIGYYPSADSNAAILRNVLLNGKLPFDEAKDLIFNRMWIDENKDFLMATDENQGVPSQVQNPSWISTELFAADMSVEGSLQFYFNEGSNELTIQSVQSVMGISYIKLIPTDGLKSYNEYKEQLTADGVQIISSEEITDGAITVQAEDTLYKSSSTLMAVNDRTSPLTVPYHSSNIVLNTIGGNGTWESVGKEITWEITVPKSGLYKIACRYMQAENRDFYSTRELRINGSVPFEEASYIEFYYDSEFQLDYLGNEDGAYYFYLNEGSNTISMTVALGELSYAIEQTTISIKNFNALYRRLTAVMSSEPDQYRDYKILESIPDFVEILKVEYYRLNSVMESLGDTIDNSPKTREISKLLYQLEVLISKPDKISVQLKEFNNNLSAISEWMLSLSDQELQLDYIMACGEGYELPRAEANFFQQAVHNVKAFIGSFTNDYIISGTENTDNKKELVVWIATTTRDQYDIAQRMVNNAFKDEDYYITIKMVGADTVMPATLTGNGPDVAIQLNYTMPTNFAYRSAAYDLTQFEDFEEVASQFSAGAMEYFEFNGGYYALPDQMSFPVLYYRTDVFEEMGLEVPNTWDEFIALVPYLQSDNLSAYMITTGHTVLGGSSSTSTKPVNAVFLSMLYQNGEELYKENNTMSNLDSMGSLLTFKYWTEFYTKQSFPVSISVITRFRTGEVPILIEDYSYTNYISATAPEIEGDWAIAPLPGTLKEDGTFDRSTSCMVGAAMIVKNIVEQNDTAEEAWEFLKWWTSADTQVTYANEQKAILGDSADFPVANLEALRKLATDRGISDTIEETISWLRGMPQVPGGYITGRNVENAFLNVYYNSINAVDTLYSQVRTINSEITIKRREFGLDE